MKEQEKQRVTHIMILIVYTIATMVLTGESFLLGWEKSAVILLNIGVITSWIIHIASNIPDLTRLWIYLVLTMLSFFFYGIHETSIYDLAPVMIVVILMYSATEMYSVIRFCVGTYYFTMIYDLVFVMTSSEFEFTPLTITRTLLHFLLIYAAAKLVKVEIQRRGGERKKTDEKIAELEEINRRTEDFLTNVSHEIRTPVNAVTGITSVMLQNEGDEEKRKDLLSIQTAGHRLFKQIGDILDYTEIATGRVKVSEETYMISSLVNDIIVKNSMMQRKHKLELIFDVDADIPSVLLGDDKKIIKILEHLIDNAYKYTKKGGIYVRIYALPKPYGINLCIRVSDTGIGMTKEEVEKSREVYYQSDSGRTRKAGGLGLGFPIVYGMVNAMEGFIQIESTIEEGTTVSISIPQKVSVATACMEVKNRQSLSLACYLRPEKYEMPAVRDYYGEIISNLVRELDLTLHRVFKLEELKRLVSTYQLTHLFIGKEEYEEDEHYFESLTQQMKVIVVADESLSLPYNSKAEILQKPFNSLMVVNILNSEIGDEEAIFRDKHMICSGIRALVVDDEPMNLMVAEGVFSNYQIEVTTAESGLKAIKTCETEDFDVIFLDHMMPEMDGIETLKSIRKIYGDSGRTAVFIAFTANAVSGAREMFLQEGFDEFVAKPVETLELERILRKVLPKNSITYVGKNYKNNKRAQESKIEESKTEDISCEHSSNTKTEDKLLRLERNGISINSGLQYCGDEDFYIQMLNEFVKGAKGKLSAIDASFQQEDYGKYCIQVHALKSTAKMIGADSLSKNARHAEDAAKEQDVDYIKQNHEKLLDEYREVVKLISEVFEQKENDLEQKTKEERIELSRDEFLQQLERLKGVLDTFEEDKAETLISEMNGFTYQEENIQELLGDIQQDVENFEFTVAAEKVDTMIKKVEGGE